MQKSLRSQFMNADNVYQGTTKRVLCACSAGLLRSPTIANVLQSDYEYNVRACGTDPSYALIPISEVLVEWAHIVVFANKENYNDVKADYPESLPYVILDLPDSYGYNDPTLVEIVRRKLRTLHAAGEFDNVRI